MTNIALENYEVVEMNNEEVTEVEAGGLWGVVCKCVAYGLAAAAVYADSQGW
ncbi:hypothetical protein [Spirosoma flavum]|uniref:Class IIb bacteriocin, lactobin A/cerein 7B family n=1 Tax=Spirosoma flavum TaxID=2048557 RepID=A0ABW6AHC4_9BACT